METLQSLRQRRDLTRAELAARVGVSYQRVWAWERGRAQPRLRHVPGLAAVLGVSPARVLELLQPTDAVVAAAGRTTQPRAGTKPGRADARILAALRDGWTSAAAVARRLKTSESTAYRALWRLQRRGLAEHRAGGGYRATGPSA